MKKKDKTVTSFLFGKDRVKNIALKRTSAQSGTAFLFFNKYRKNFGF